MGGKYRIFKANYRFHHFFPYKIKKKKENSDGEAAHPGLCVAPPLVAQNQLLNLQMNKLNELISSELQNLPQKAYH